MCCCQNTPVQTITYNLLCTFSVHNITVRHNVLLSEHTGTGRHSTICYVRSVCTTLLYDTMCCCQNTLVQAVTHAFFLRMVRNSQNVSGGFQKLTNANLQHILRTASSIMYLKGQKCQGFSVITTDVVTRAEVQRMIQ
jgi:hypothetical protein